MLRSKKEGVERKIDFIFKIVVHNIVYGNWETEWPDFCEIVYGTCSR
jgi:hypothetical protein